MTDLVRVHVNDQSINLSAVVAEKAGLKPVDEPTHNRDGSIRLATRANGRASKPKTTVADSAAGKKVAVTDSAPDKKGSDK